MESFFSKQKAEVPLPSQYDCITLLMQIYAHVGSFYFRLIAYNNIRPPTDSMQFLLLSLFCHILGIIGNVMRGVNTFMSSFP